MSGPTRTPGALVRLETDRYRVRSMTREDVGDAYIGWMADPEVMLGLNLPRRRLTRPQAVRWVLSHDNHRRFCLLVETREDAQPIGFFTITAEPAHRVAETAVVIGERSHWGQDVVKEARSAILDFIFDELDMHKVIGRPHGRNFASIWNYKALGFTCEAVLREQMRAVAEDERLDQLVFGMLRTDWQARKEKAGS